MRILLAILAVLLLAGCSDSAQPEADTAHQKPAAQKPPADEIDLGDVDVPSRKKDRESKREREVAALEAESKQGDDGPRRALQATTRCAKSSRSWSARAG